MKRRLLIEIAIAAIAILSIVQQSFGRGSLASENPWSSGHVGSLPSEIRSDLRNWEVACGEPSTAGHYSAVHLAVNGTRFIALHFEGYRCPGKRALCRRGECLHEIYATTHSHFRRVLSLNAQDIRMIRKDDHALLEVSGATGDAYVLWWNGARFLRSSDQQTILRRSQTGTNNE